jgi:hypothetical protein
MGSRENRAIHDAKVCEQTARDAIEAQNFQSRTFWVSECPEKF